MKLQVRFLRLCFIALASAALTASFSRNAFQIAAPEWFEEHQHDTEAHVIGRMVIARQYGLFSFGGLTGVGTDRVLTPQWPRGWPSHRETEDQYQAYLANTGFENFDPYRSQPGMQAMLLSIADHLLPMSSAAKLDVFRWTTSLLTAMTLSFALLWIFLELGFVAVLLAGLSLLSSQWLCVFGRNLWWCLWSFYLPMVAVMWFLRGHPATTCRTRTLALTIFASLFLKCLLTGFEYITTTCVMLVVPLAYYHAKTWPGTACALRQWGVAVAAATGAMLLTATILSIQIACETGRWGASVEHLQRSLVRRTSGSVDDVDLHAQWPATVRAVLQKYNRGVFVYRDRLPGVARREERDPTPIRYADLMDAFAIASGLAVVLLVLPGSVSNKRTLRAAVLATWFALLAPYSWFIVFRAHSTIHGHMNYITWQMPYTFFGAALVGLVLAQSCGAVVRCLRRAPTTRVASTVLP